MLPILYLVFLCSNFLFIKSEDDGNLTIEVNLVGKCKINHEGYTFTEGQHVTLIVIPQMFINHGWWNVNTSTGSKELYNKLRAKDSSKAPFSYTTTVYKSMDGTWEFKFYYNRDTPDFPGHTNMYNNVNFTVSECKTNVTIEPNQTPKEDSETNLIIIASAVFAIQSVIILAQAAYIVFLKAQARKLITLNTHNNLSKKSGSISNDTARYCSNPGQKMMKEPIPVENDSRDSVIYEAPNIEIPSNGRMPMQPPQPPAINTMPRTPRSDHNMRIGPQGMMASALNSSVRSPIADGLSPNFQRSTHNDRENSVANRPPQPLPPQGHNDTYQDVYEEMEPTYEPPPVINTVPPRLPMPPEKVPTANLLDVKENTLKFRGGNNKLPVTPKPQPHRALSSNTIPLLQLSEELGILQTSDNTTASDTMTQANELEQALRRRNNTEGAIARGPPPGHMMQPQHQEQSLRRRLNDTMTQANELEQALRRRNNTEGAIARGPPPGHMMQPQHQEQSLRRRPNGDAQARELEDALRRRNNVDAQTNELEEALRRRNNVLQVPIVSIPDPSSRSSPKPRPGPPSVQQSRPPPVRHPVQEEIYYNEASSDEEEWTYEPLKPLNSYDQNIYNV